MADFDALVAAAHERGLRVLLDYVPNHTSNQHPWFLESRKSRNNSKRDWYVWRDPGSRGGPPNNWVAVFGGPAWTLDKATGQYYYHAFLKEQPDLNWRNPDVQKTMFDVIRFWLGRGVDGFRVDTIWLLLEDDQLRDNPVNPNFRPGMLPAFALTWTRTADQPDTHTSCGACDRCSMSFRIACSSPSCSGRSPASSRTTARPATRRSCPSTSSCSTRRGRRRSSRI